MRVLSDMTNRHINKISNHIADKYETSYEESGTTSPVFDFFYNKRSKDAIKSIVNFTPMEFMDIWIAISTFLLANWNTSRGIKTSFTSKNVLFMVPTVLRHGQQWDLTKTLFRNKCNTFIRVVTTKMNKSFDYLHENCVKRVQGK